MPVDKLHAVLRRRTLIVAIETQSRSPLTQYLHLGKDGKDIAVSDPIRRLRVELTLTSFTGSRKPKGRSENQNYN